MSKRLSKISKELNVSISTIVDFLSKNGYQCEDYQNKVISDDVIEFIYSNIKSYVIELDNVDSANSQKKSGQDDDTFIPLELKIVDAACKKKKLIERIIGISDFRWHYTIAKYKGVCSQPVDFNIFDEAICSILLKGETNAKTIGEILGFDIETDPAEREILFAAIEELINDKMVEVKDAFFFLTDVGRKYAEDGVKFSTFERNFELYVDAVGGLRENAKEVLVKLKSEKLSGPLQNNLPRSIEDVRLLAEVQAPEIHFPSKRFYLQYCQPIETEGYVAKVWVVLLENFRDNVIRALVYDEKQGAIIDTLSNAFDSLSEEKNKLFERFLTESEEDNLLERTLEQKNEKQILSERELIEKQNEIDTAIGTQNLEKVASAQKKLNFDKHHFDPLEFQLELKRLFCESNGELWLISPWIKKRAMIKIIPLIEIYLKKGGRIFVIFSLPENEKNWNYDLSGKYVVSWTNDNNKDEKMADVDMLNKLRELEQKYQNFYILQLPAFHEKLIWVRSNDGNNSFYTGSYNILSFYVNQSKQSYRQELMSRLDWGVEEEEMYNKKLEKFGEKYLREAFVELNDLCADDDVVDKNFIRKIERINYDKLKLFLNRGYDDFNRRFVELERTREERISKYRKIYYVKLLYKLKSEIAAVNKTSLTFERKMYFQKQLNSIVNEYNDITQTTEYNVVNDFLRNTNIV